LKKTLIFLDFPGEWRYNLSVGAKGKEETPAEKSSAIVARHKNLKME
jgi:hypothetical protein